MESEEISHRIEVYKRKYSHPRLLQVTGRHLGGQTNVKLDGEWWMHLYIDADYNERKRSIGDKPVKEIAYFEPKRG